MSQSISVPKIKSNPPKNADKNYLFTPNTNQPNHKSKEEKKLTKQSRFVGEEKNEKVETEKNRESAGDSKK